MKEGKLKIKNSLRGFIQSSGKKYNIPTEYVFENRDLNNKMCQFELDENNKIINIIVDGIQLSKNQAVLDKKEESRNRREEEKIREQQKQEEEKRRQRNSNKGAGDDTFSLDECFPPSDTKRSNIITSQIDNFHLKLNKFPRFKENEKDKSKSKFYFFESNRGRKPNQIVANFGDIDFSELANRQISGAQAICSNNTLHFNSETSWKMVNGLGGHSVYETSITLHHIYGFPYIPSSSIKGVVRSWIITEVFGNIESDLVPAVEKKHPLLNAECRAYENEFFCKIFGCPATFKRIKFNDNGEPIKKREKYDTITVDVALKNKNEKGESNIGNIIFFDAFPVNKPNIETDIMNPHYSKYYQDSKNKNNTEPKDTEKPIPVFFLTVNNTSFQFIIGSKEKEGLNWEIKGKTIVYWLQSALEDHGIGAKTAVGYGYFNKIEK